MRPMLFLVPGCRPPRQLRRDWKDLLVLLPEPGGQGLAGEVWQRPAGLLSPPPGLSLTPGLLSPPPGLSLTPCEGWGYFGCIPHPKGGIQTYSIPCPGNEIISSVLESGWAWRPLTCGWDPQMLEE